MVRPRARDSHSGRIVVGDLLWLQWVADVEHTDAGTEIATSQRRRIALVIHAAVMAAVSESGKTHDVG